MDALQVGANAPDFTLDGSGGTPFRLSQAVRESRFVVLVFYPLAFSPVCTQELNLFQEILEQFGELGAQVVGISVDSKYTQRAFAEANKITFPLLADFHPKGAVAQQYGAMREDGVAERALFVVDSQMRVRYSFVSEFRKNPGADRLLEALEGMQG